jgi:hypothetical protein
MKTSAFDNTSVRGQLDRLRSILANDGATYNHGPESAAYLRDLARKESTRKRCPTPPTFRWTPTMRMT